MTFKVCNLGSKYPYFNRAYVVSGDFGWTHLYVFMSNNLPTQIFGDATVLQTILAGSDVQSLFSAHSSIGAELVKRAD